MQRQLVLGLYCTSVETRKHSLHSIMTWGTWRLRALDNDSTRHIFPQRPQCSSFPAHLVHILILSAKQTNHPSSWNANGFYYAHSAEAPFCRTACDGQRSQTFLHRRHTWTAGQLVNNALWLDKAVICPFFEVSHGHVTIDWRALVTVFSIIIIFFLGTIIKLFVSSRIRIRKRRISSVSPGTAGLQVGQIHKTVDASGGDTELISPATIVESRP